MASQSSAVAEPNPAVSSFAEDDDHSSTKFPIAGIVASAGGLDAFKKFFADMPNKSGVAFVLIPHLDSKRKSSMVDLIMRQTSMPVVEATDGMLVEVNSIVIIPPNHFLAISNGILQLSDLPDPLGSQTAIDFFLRSLAEDQQERAIGIVFSGTGCHGTLGIRALLQECQQVLRDHKLLETEIHTNDKRCFLRRILPFRSPDRSADGVVVTFVDLTALKLAEAEQRERDARFREVFDHAPTGIGIMSWDGLLVKCNPAFCKIVGYPEEELYPAIYSDG